MTSTEPEPLPSDIPLDSLDLVAQQAPVIARSKETVISEMENMVVRGLANLVCSELRKMILANHYLRSAFRINHYCRPRYRQRITCGYFRSWYRIFWPI